jgi:HAD superfamily hydrolase (TIGR01549 family)
MDELRAGRMADVGLTGAAAREADLAYRGAASAVNLRRGARALLEGIRDAGMETVILTNGTVDPQRLKAEQTGLLHLVAGVVVSEEVGYHKPDRRAFAAALAVTGAPAARAAMVGDRWEFDISGALESGFARAVWVARTRRRPDDPRVKIAKSLPQVLPALLD